VPSEFRVQILGNARFCRAEAEVYRSQGGAPEQLLAWVYESQDGWKVEFDDCSTQPPDLVEALLAAGQAALSPYVNRKGENPPPGLSVPGLSLWLMEKTAGTATGIRSR